MAKNFDDDEYVAELLKQDAKNAAKKYELVGIDAFNPRRANTGAPKLNKNFLRNIIRQTDRHNAALLAKEAEESRARLKTMDHERNRGRTHGEEGKERRAPGRLTPVLGDDDLPKARSRRRRDYSEDGDECRRRRRRSREQEASESTSSRRHQARSRDKKRQKRRYESDDEYRSRRKRKRSRSPYERAHKYRGSDTGDDRGSHKRDHKDQRHRGPRSYSPISSKSRSPSPRSDRHERRRRSRRRSSKDISKSPERKSSHRKQLPNPEPRAASPAYDSDPLEAIVGPLPLLPEPTVRSKGRGTFKSNSMGIESRFSSTYDPAIDVCAGSDNEDDWGDALEVLRDRSRWKQQGADRLRAAGFTEEQVKKWERGEEQNEDDVVWKGKGEAREWDRGKVLDEDGDVGLETDFGRLK